MIWPLYIMLGIVVLSIILTVMAVLGTAVVVFRLDKPAKRVRR